MDSSPTHLFYAVADRSYSAILKKEIRALATTLGFTKTAIAEIDILVAEIASNLIKHAKNGELLVKVIQGEKSAGLELLAIDHGPGMSEVASMIKDGTSTVGTLGQGLGAITRLSDFFQIYSVPSWGTILLSRKYVKKQPENKKEKVEVRYVNVPKIGESVSGDGIFHYITPDYLKVIALDGLGHGPDAHLASQKAIDEFKNCPLNNAVDIIRYLHPLLKRTRGAVAAVGIFSFEKKQWSVSGVGNIASRLSNGIITKSYMSYNGIVGLTMPSTMQETSYDHFNNQLLIMMSDGIKTQLDIQKYPNILKYDLVMLAAAIYKDLGRRTDDMSVVISRVTL